jgi:hypothetical protein
MRFTRLDLPAPVWPTIASEPPAGTLKLTSRSTVVGPYAKLTLRNSTSPPIVWAAGVAGSAMSGVASQISWSRWSEAQPCWKRFETQPRAIIGHASRFRYATNCTS